MTFGRRAILVELDPTNSRLGNQGEVVGFDIHLLKALADDELAVFESAKRPGETARDFVGIVVNVGANGFECWEVSLVCVSVFGAESRSVCA